MKPHQYVRQLRLQQGLTQQQVADQLHLSRPAYTKLEAGQTSMGVETLHQLASILRVPVGQLLTTPTGPIPCSGYNDIDFMLEMVYHHLSWGKLTVVPYEELTADQLIVLAAKGFTSREAYEDTPLGGRIYAYGPLQVVRLMLGALDMAVLFKQHLVQNARWLAHWQWYQEYLLAPPTMPVPEVDEQEYFVVFLISLTMPDGAEQYVQLAQRDIPAGLDEDQALEKLIAKMGAIEGDISAFCVDGYTPYDEIITEL